MGVSVLLTASVFSSMVIFVARGRSSSILEGSSANKVLRKRSGFSPTVNARVATSGWRFGMLRQALAKRAIYCLSDSFFPSVTWWSEAEEVVIGLLSINRAIKFEDRVRNKLTEFRGKE